MECKIFSKFEDKVFIKLNCTDLDLLKIKESDYWKNALEDNASLNLLFIDEDNFERYEHKISFSSFDNIVPRGDVQYQGTLSSEDFSEDLFKKISRIRIGTIGLKKRNQ